jgi:uncharacterized membrane protein YbhN (UPF0104 family)
MPLPRSWKDPHALLALAIAAVLVAAVLLGVERFVGWGTVAATAGRVRWTTWAGFASLLGLSYAARALRLWRLLHDLDERARVSRAATVFVVHNARATLLPARLGEAAMPLLARRWVGVDWAATLGALAWWRLSDLAIVATLALGLLAAGATVLAPLYALALAACALPFAVFVLRAGLLRKLGAHASADPRWRTLLRRVLGGMPARARSLTADLALAALAWGAKLAAFAALMRGALGGVAPDIPPLPLLAAAGLAGDAGGALPMPTLGGIGPFEAGIVLGLAALRIDTAAALAIGVTLHGAVLVSIVATGLAALACGLLLERHGHVR